ncbi:MAG: EamA family transporter RarD [Acidobacteria bacterium]|nr:MAG: EamA family transporter RarD [Acidobacteriota bacterium]REK00270.1 MAG: EamA family transporter RarD [Acidobacteriota bacterium]
MSADGAGEAHAGASPRQGWLCGIAAYLIWGFAPLYWRLVRDLPAVTLLALRVLFAAAMLALLLFWLRRRQDAGGSPQRLRLRRHLNRRTLAFFLVAALLIGTNWFVFLWAVLTDRVVEAALGYFVNPLVNVALGTLVLGERLRPLQWTAIVLAAIGVGIFAWTTGGLPWISLVLAGSFGLYGLVRKTAPAGALEGSALEMLFLVPLAVAGLALVGPDDLAVLAALDVGGWLLLSVSGLITVSPLLLFTRAARILPLSSIGFLQYLAPTCQFLLAVLLFAEPFDRGRLVAFLWIWTALALFTLDLRSAARASRRRALSTGGPAEDAAGEAPA